MKKFKNLAYATSATVLGTLVLTACGDNDIVDESAADSNGENNAVTDTSNDPDPDEEIEIQENPDADHLFEMGTIPTGTSWYLYMSESANVINANSEGVNISVRETGGPVNNAIELANDSIDIGFIEAFVADESYNGIGRFEDEGHNEDLRIFSYVAESTMHWAVTEESGIREIEELEGEEFNPSSVGGGGEYITEFVFETIGVQPDFQRMQLDDAADRVRNGQLNGFSYNGTPPIPAFTEVNSAQPLHILSLSDEQVEAVENELPFLSGAVIPEGAYEGTEEAQTIGVYMGMGMNSDLDEDAVYDMASAYYENLEDIGEVFALATESTPEDTIENTTVPLHAGVVRYFEDEGIDVPEELIPEEYDG
jgi:uncharacterized protein